MLQIVNGTVIEKRDVSRWGNPTVELLRYQWPSADALIQKRAYRIITKLSELKSGSTAVAQFISDIENVMVDSASSVQTSAKAARLTAIKTIVELLPLDHLDFIVRTVAEVILSTKDVNEKSRETAFDTLICMGRKMNEPNGIIKLSQIPGYDPTTPDQSSSVPVTAG